MTRLVIDRRDRRGTVLLIVLTMLCLFAAIAMAFVFYADAEATAARYSREAENKLTPDVEPELAAALFLSQLLYGTNDPTSALYQQDLAQNMTKIPYTYPDLNNFFLGAVKADGTVLAQSFVRPTKSLRPNAKDHAGFPPLEDGIGDVRNLQFRPGPNDSIWLDIGAPVMTAPNGQKYKMLVAPFIMDMDGMASVNHPDKINLGKVLNADDSEWRTLGNNPNIGPSHLEALYRFGDTNSSALTSDLFKRLPKNLADPRRRRMITTGSGSRDLPASIYINRDVATQAQKQQLARELYQASTRVTGTIDPNSNFNKFNPVTEDFRKARVLAQMAVNLVDFRDEDGDLTPFQWITSNSASAHVMSNFVFGTEKPRLLLNEVYLQYDNNGADGGFANQNAPDSWQATGYKLNVWVELHNPTTWDEDLSSYQIVVCHKDATLRDADNTRGAPLPAKIFGKINFNAGTKATANGLVSLAPNASFLAGRNPNLGDTMMDKLSCSLALNAIPVAEAANYKPIVLLRRKARSDQPLNDPDEPGYTTANPLNPYVTIDYVQEKMWDNRVYAPGKKDPVPPGPATFHAMGRTHPYVATNLAVQTSGNGASLPKNTFSGANDGSVSVITIPGSQPAPPNTPPPAAGPVQNLTWIDGKINSIFDLLDAPACRPQELTQLFTATGTAKAHCADWLKENTYLFALFDHLRTWDTNPNSPVSGLIPGRTNINSIWEREVWEALCDHPQAGALWDSVLSRRTPGIFNLSIDPKKVIGPTIFENSIGPDRPFVSLAAGRAFSGVRASAIDINNTILAGANVQPYDPAGQRLVGLPGATSAEKLALLSKLHGKFTVRSNSFAVWATVGFFEVKEDKVPLPYIPPPEENQPRHLIFVLDTSGSMNKPSGLPLAKSALALLVNKLGPSDRVSIVAFASAARVALTSTSGDQKTTILNALNGLQSTGGSREDLGLIQAYQVAVQNFIPGGINRIILATDGDFNVPATLKPLIMSHAEKGITLSSLGFTNTANNNAKSNLTLFAAQGSGQFAQIDNLQNEAQRRFVEQGAGLPLGTVVGGGANRDGRVYLGAEIGRSENRHLRHRFFAIIDRTDLGITVGPAPVKLSGAVNAGLVTITGRTFPTKQGPPYRVEAGHLVVIEPNTLREEAVTVSAVTNTGFTITLQQAHDANAELAFRGPWSQTVSPRNDPGVVRYFSVID